MRRRLLLAASAATLILALTAPASLAVRPVQDSYDAEWDTTTTDICPFEVAVHLHVIGAYSQFLDQDGVQTKWIEQDIEQDVFSANGKTLTGLPFRYVSIFTNNPDGSLASYYSSGGVEQVPLPDGSVFWSAGRFDWFGAWADHPALTFTITPTHGHSGNVDAFCAALS